jgi:hypothetical protein
MHLLVVEVKVLLQDDCDGRVGRCLAERSWQVGLEIVAHAFQLDLVDAIQLQVVFDQFQNLRIVNNREVWLLPFTM